MAIRMQTVRARWRPQKERGHRNATEARFEANVLTARQLVSEIVRQEYEGLRFRFCTDDKATQTPDFILFRSDGEIELIDVKGSAGWEDATRNKIKACARLYPEFHWIGYIEARGRKGVFTPEAFQRPLHEFVDARCSECGCPRAIVFDRVNVWNTLNRILRCDNDSCAHVWMEPDPYQPAIQLYMKPFCPRCKSEKTRVYKHQTGSTRRRYVCRSCGHRWSSEARMPRGGSQPGKN